MVDYLWIIRVRTWLDFEKNTRLLIWKGKGFKRLNWLKDCGTLITYLLHIRLVAHDWNSWIKSDFKENTDFRLFKTVKKLTQLAGNKTMNLCSRELKRAIFAYEAKIC